MRRLPTLAAVITLFLVVTLHARATDPHQDEAFRDATTDWASADFQSLQSGRTVVVFERAQPQKRRVCHVRELRADRLVCSKKLHRDQIFPAHDVLAVLEPRDRSAPRIEGTAAAIGFGLIAAGFFAGPAAPALWVVGGLIVLTVPAMAMGDNGPLHDSVLYYAPGSQPKLAVQ